MSASIRTRPISPSWLGVSCALLLGSLGSQAHAAVLTGISEECGSVSAFDGELQRRIGPEALELTRVTLTSGASGYDLLVQVGDARRELHDANCQVLLRAALVVVAALAEPTAKPENPTKPVPVAPASGALEKPSVRRRPRFALGAAAGLHLGTLPKPTLLVDLDAQLQWSHSGLAAGLRYLLPNATLDQAGHGVHVAGVGAYLAGVVTPWPRVQGRLGVVGYRLSGTGLGSVEHTQDTAWEGGPLLGVSFLPVLRPPFWLSIGAEGQLNLLRAHFEIAHYGTVFSVPSLSASAFARAGVVW